MQIKLEETDCKTNKAAKTEKTMDKKAKKVGLSYPSEGSC